MKKSLAILLLTVCGAMLYAQAPVDKSKADTSAAAKKAAAAKQADQEPEDSVVMIDSKGSDSDNDEGSRVSGSDQEEAAVPGGLPSSFGLCMGLITEAGRTVMVFESPDDGTISFVQILLGKNRVSWKLLDRIPRSAD